MANLLKCYDNNRQYLNIKFTSFKTILWDNHLYTPLISFESKNWIKITPVQLNSEVIPFVEDLEILVI